MIKSVTDFRIAMDNHLLPEDFTPNGSMETAFENRCGYISLLITSVDNTPS